LCIDAYVKTIYFERKSTFKIAAFSNWFFEKDGIYFQRLAKYWFGWSGEGSS